ncbi:MAG TPA: ABC-F family ATP-binding cassette domain-containing protein [Trueperaceae bacterium]
MELLTVRDLTIEHQGRMLLAGADLTVREGMRIGLIGGNGSGKSTLLEVLAGVRQGDGGRVRRAPGIAVGFLPQWPRLGEDRNVWEAALEGISRITRLELELRELEGGLSRGEGSLEEYGELREAFERAGGYAAEAVLREHLAALGIGDRQLELNVGRLSGGERARLALARVLAAEPPLLFLDEPTNHLDLPALEWLGKRLRRWSGAVVLVSHDRELLDLVCTHAAELRDERLEISRGGYSRLREQQGVMDRATERRERERRKEAARLEGIARELRSWGSAQAQRRRRRAERDRETLGAVARERHSTSLSGLPAPTTREAEGRLLEARRLTSVAGDRELFEGAHLTIDAGDKIALLGPNGSGKSTLLRLIAGEEQSDDPRAEFRWHRDIKLLYSGQSDRGMNDDRMVLEQLTELVSGDRARMLLSLSGLPRETWGRLPGELSGGERARAGLARLLAAEANLMLLDEPSNDLDLYAIETLHSTLAASEAAIVFATHDRALARLAQRVWSIEEGELVEYRGGFEGYLAGRRRLEPGVEAASPGDQADSHEAAPEEGDDLESLELERLGVEARLEDPLRLTERERLRLEERHRQLIDLLSLAYDSRLPPPLPPFSLGQGAVRLAAEIGGEGLTYFSDAPVEMKLIVRDRIGHLTLRESEDSALLPWARGALVDAAVRLAFYALAPDAVQYQYRPHFGSALLEQAEGGWWTIDRRRFERLEGWDRGTDSGRLSSGSKVRARRRRRSKSASSPGPEAAG